MTIGAWILVCPGKADHFSMIFMSRMVCACFIYPHSQEGEGLIVPGGGAHFVPGIERHERLFEVRTRTYA